MNLSQINLYQSIKIPFKSHLSEIDMFKIFHSLSQNMKFFRCFGPQFDGIGHPIEMKISYFNRKFKYLRLFDATGYQPKEVKKWII